MKNFGTIVGIVITTVLIVIVGVLTYHSMFGSSKAAVEKTYDIPGLKSGKTQPKSSLPANQFGESSESAIPLTGDSTSDSLLNELNTTIDDGGAKELQTIEQEASQL